MARIAKIAAAHVRIVSLIHTIVLNVLQECICNSLMHNALPLAQLGPTRGWTIAAMCPIVWIVHILVQAVQITHFALNVPHLSYLMQMGYVTTIKQGWVFV